MKHLTYKDEALAAYKKGGREAGIMAVMDNMLTNVYMGTDNSSTETLNAAKTLIEGGTRKDGTAFQGASAASSSTAMCSALSRSMPKFIQA